jgi:sarcosine oxidase
MGLAAADALGRRGHDVDLYEQFEVDHARGSSHGRSRIFRLSYPGADWVRLAREAYAGWRELERDTGEELLVLNGLLEFGETSEAALDSCGVEWAPVEPDELAERFGVRANERALLQPEAGYVRADSARRAFLTRGVFTLHERTAVDSIDSLDADVVVVTAGPWAPKLLAAEGVDLKARVTRETVAYFALEDERVPSIIEYRSGTTPTVYALHDPVHGLKAGMHMAGEEVDPDVRTEPDPRLVDQVAAWVGERYLHADPTPVALDTCMYTTMPDEEFVLERRGRVVVGSACSGHGFKFAPVVGERLAALASAGGG